MDFHPVAGIFPMMSAEEFAALKADIAENGLREPIWLHDGQIVDGRNRFNACEAVGVEPRFREWDGNGSLKAFVVSLNLIRRHLNETQRGMCAARMANMPLGGAIYRSANLQTDEEMVSRAEAAEMFNVSERTVSDCAKVIEEKADNLIELCDAGKLAASTAASIAQKPADFQKIVAEKIKSGDARSGQEAIRLAKADIAKADQIEAAKDVTHNSNIIVGDFWEQSDNIPDNSLSLIFTDPSYSKDAEADFPHLADFAARKLARGGSILFYLGHLQLPAAFKAFDGKLRHWWTCACVHAGARSVMNYYGVRVGWKPMLWFVKETRFDIQNMATDTVSGATEKDYHKWQQAEDEARYWIEKLCPAGGIVCDPFLGGGTTAAAAQKLNRKWIAFEIDPDTARIASDRLEKENDTKV